MNHRFANLVLLPGQEHENHFSPADRFPFSYAMSTDHFTGQDDAILKRPETDPQVIHTDTACEYWHRRASLVHTDTEGNDLPSRTMSASISGPARSISPRRSCRRPPGASRRTTSTSSSTSMLFRADLDRLDAWVEPTAGRRRRAAFRARGGRHAATLRGHGASDFPAHPRRCPAARPEQAGAARLRARTSMRGMIANEPPEILAGECYPVQMPAVDERRQRLGRHPRADGRRRRSAPIPAGAAAPRLRPWRHGRHHRQLHPVSRQRGRTRPDRRSAALGPARYGTPDGYSAAIRQAAEALVTDGLMLRRT